MKKYLLLLSLSGLALMVSGCTSSQTALPAPVPLSSAPSYPEGSLKVAVKAPVNTAIKEETVDLSQKSQVFIDGKNDGCATAKGKYTKNSALYNANADYSEGWFYGRRSCQRH